MTRDVPATGPLLTGSSGAGALLGGGSSRADSSGPVAGMIPATRMETR